MYVNVLNDKTPNYSKYFPENKTVMLRQMKEGDMVETQMASEMSVWTRRF